MSSPQPPTLAEYARRGIRIALVGGPNTCKSTVFRELDRMRTPSQNLRLYEHPDLPLEDPRPCLERLKGLIADTQQLPDPCDHVYAVWYFAGDRWCQNDEQVVSQLGDLCYVIVIITADDRSASAAVNVREQHDVESAVRERFPDVPVVYCRSNGRSVDGTEIINEDTGEGDRDDTGYKQLFHESMKMLPTVHARSLRQVEYMRTRQDRRKLWASVAVGIAVILAAIKLGPCLRFKRLFKVGPPQLLNQTRLH